MFCPPVQVLQNESASLTIEVLLLEQLGDSHCFYRFTSSMGQEKRHTTLLESGYGKFVGDVHQTFNVVPGDGAFGATERIVNFRGYKHHYFVNLLRVNELQEVMECSSLKF